MHYRLDGFLGLPRSLGPLDPWLKKQSGVERLDGNTVRVARPTEPSPRVLVFQPSSGLKVWSEGLAAGWAKLDEARKLMQQGEQALPQAAALVKEAYDDAEGIAFAFQWARALAQSGQAAEAMKVLEKALAGAGRDDWEYRMRSRALLAELYAAAGRRDEAVEQSRIVRDNAQRSELIDKANAFLKSSN